MRRADHVPKLEERVVGPEAPVDERLLPPCVDACAELRVGPQVLVDRALVDDRPPGDVHQDGRRLHPLEAAAADQASGGPGERQGDDHDVELTEDGVQVAERSDELDGLVGATRRVDRKDASPERTHQPGGGLADSSEAEDPADALVKGE